MADTIFRELDVDNIDAYVRTQPGISGRVGAVQQVTQSGEGKINGVFFVTGSSSSVVLKQSLPWVRTLPDWELTAERVGREAKLLERWSAFNSDYIPELWQYDEQEHILAMENLAGHVLLREVLNSSAAPEAVGTGIGVMLARTAYHTSAFSLPAVEHSAAVRAGQNPEMSHLMEDVVFNLPFSTSDSNVAEPHIATRRAELLGDADALRSVRYLKWVSATRQEALIHGDLHTGSLMVQGSDIRVIDAEFGRYGPIAWDIGELWAHLAIAAQVHETRSSYEGAEATRALIAGSWVSFQAELRRLVSEDDAPGSQAAMDDWMRETEVLAIRFAGVETLRRIIGVGDCEQLTVLAEGDRRRATDALIDSGRSAMVNGTWLGKSASSIRTEDGS